MAWRTTERTRRTEAKINIVSEWYRYERRWMKRMKFEGAASYIQVTLAGVRRGKGRAVSIPRQRPD